VEYDAETGFRLSSPTRFPGSGSLGVRAQRWGQSDPLPEPSAGVETTGPGEVPPLPTNLAVLTAVVLVENVGAVYPQVAAGEEQAVLVVHLELWLDRHVADKMQHPKQRLPRRFRPAVDPGQDPTQHRRSAAVLVSREVELARRAPALVERRVAEDDEV
jgi:hypothetical protein